MFRWIVVGFAAWACVLSGAGAAWARDKSPAVCSAVGRDCDPKTLARLGEADLAKGRFPEGEASLRRSAELFASAGDDEGHDAVLLTLAQAFLRDAQYLKAEAILVDLYPSYSAREGTRQVVIAGIEADLAHIYVATNRMGNVPQMVNSAIGRLAQAPITPTEAGVLASQLGVAQGALRNFAAAKVLLAQAMAAPSGGPAGPVLWKADAQAALGDIAYEELRLADAEAFYRGAAKDYGALGKAAARRFRLNNLASVLISERKLDEGSALLRSQLAEIQAQKPADPLEAARVEANLASASVQLGQYKEARELGVASLAHFRAAGVPAGDPQTSGVLFVLGKAEEGLGEYASAEARLRESLMTLERVSANPGYTANSLQALCEVLHLAGRVSEEIVCAEDLVSLVSAWPGADAGWRVNVQMILGNARFNDARYPAARDAYQAAVSIASTRPPNRLSAGASMSLGQVLSAMGEPQEARKALVSAQQTFADVGAADEDQGVEAGRRLGDVLVDLGQYKDAEPLIERSVAWFKSHLGPDHPRTSVQLRSLGKLLSVSGRPLDAEAAFKQALVIRRGAQNPNLSTVAQSLSDLGYGYLQRGRFQDARLMFVEAETTQVSANGASGWVVGVAARQVGEVDTAQGHYADAEAAYARAAVLLDAGGEPAKREALATRVGLARLRGLEGRTREAEQILRETIEKQALLLGPASPDLDGSLAVLSDVQLAQGRFRDAEATVVRRLALGRAVFGEGSPRLAPVWTRLALLMVWEGRSADAAQPLLTGLAVQRDAAGLGDPSSIDVLLTAAWVEAARGRLAPARDYADKALAMARAGWGEGSNASISAMLTIGDIEHRDRRLPEAAETIAAALEQSRALWGTGSVATIYPLVSLARIRADQNRPQEAEALLNQATAIGARWLTPGDLSSIYLLNDLAGVYLVGKDPAKAEATLKLALERLARLPDAPVQAGAYLNLTLARTYAAQGRAADAATLEAAARAVLGGAPPTPPREQRL